jgi:hypothetical protein
VLLSDIPSSKTGIQNNGHAQKKYRFGLLGWYIDIPLQV